MDKVLPNLFCLGPLKAGTTTLYTIAEGHPDILVPSFKEPHFFVDDKKYKKGLKWYSETYYSAYNSQKYVSDFTPSYFANEEAIQRISKNLGTSIKLMYVLRNPAKRAYSHYMHWKRDGHITQPFVDFILSRSNSTEPQTDKLGRIYYDSLYDIHVANLHKYFPVPENILPLVFEEDVINKSKLFKTKVAKFLAIDPLLFVDGADEVMQNQSQSVSEFGLIIKRLINSDNFLKLAVKKIIPDSVRDKMNNFLNGKINNMFYQETTDLVDEETFKRLNNEVFLPSIKQLEVILNRSFNHWYE